MRTFNHLILAFFLVLTGCTSVEPRVAKTQLPDGTFGYIAGEFKHDERELYALSLLNINTDTNYLMASGSPAKKIKMGFASEIVMIKVPPGLYEIKYWVQIDRSGIGPIGSRARFKKDSIIAQQFKVTENSVIYLGNIEFTQERVPGGSMGSSLTNNYPIQLLMTERSALIDTTKVEAIRQNTERNAPFDDLLA